MRNQDNLGCNWAPQKFDKVEKVIWVYSWLSQEELPLDGVRYKKSRLQSLNIATHLVLQYLM